MGNIQRFLTPSVKGLVLGMFSVAGPMAVLLDAANRGGLSFEQTMVWMAGSYGVSGLCTLFLAWKTKLPVILAWNIPGAVLIGSVLPQYEFSQMVFAYIATAMLVLLSGWLGVGEKLLRMLSPAVVMGMLSGVLIPFLLRVPELVLASPVVCGVPVILFFALGAWPNLRKRMPPILAAAVSGILLTFMIAPQGGDLTWMGLNQPQLFVPQFSASVLFDVTLPVFLFIVGVNHIQSVSILRQFGYSAPSQMLNQWVGFAGLTAGFVGGSPISLGGTLMSILAPSQDEKKEDLWFGAFVFGCLFVCVALFAAVVVQLRGLLPVNLLGTLAGLALFPVVSQTLQTAVGDAKHSVAGMVALTVTLSGVQPLGWGAPLWGLIAGLVVQYLPLLSSALPVDRSPVQKHIVDFNNKQ